MTQRTRSLRVADHAVLRFRERVDPAASPVGARTAIQQIARLGKASSRPRHWMCDTRSTPGTVYIYWQQWPGVALLVRDGCVVTVCTRKLTRGAARRHRERSREAGIQLRLLDPVRRCGRLGARGMSDNRRVPGKPSHAVSLELGLKDAATRQRLSRFKRRHAADPVDVA
jgi:hypothetical protein